MGRSYTPKYRVKVTAVGAHLTDFIWNREYGRVGEANLKKFVAAYNESFEPGGCNFHGDGETTVIRITAAVIIRQSDDEVIATYTAPMFEVV
jgi:hypothetical protein